MSAPETESAPAAAPTADTSADQADDVTVDPTEALVEEVSIDGMCGVY